jgi:hypothetical protein
MGRRWEYDARLTVRLFLLVTCASENIMCIQITWEYYFHPYFDSVDLEWNLSLYISNKLLSGSQCHWAMYLTLNSKDLAGHGCSHCAGSQLLRR